MRRIIFGIIMAIALAMGIMPVVGAGSFVITPLEDANIQGGSGADKNFGSSASLILKADNYRTAFLKFDISGADSRISSAKLYVHGGLVPQSDMLKIAYVAEDGWSETTITSRNAPKEYTYIASAEYVGNKDYTFDITEAVRRESDGILSLMLYYDGSPESNYSFNSKEAAADRPMIVFETQENIKPSARGNLVQTEAFSHSFLSGGGEVKNTDGNFEVKLDSAASGARLASGKIRVNSCEVYQYSAVCTKGTVMRTIYYNSFGNELESVEAEQKSESGNFIRLYSESVACGDAVYVGLEFDFTADGMLRDIVMEHKGKYNIIGSDEYYNVMYGERYTVNAFSDCGQDELQISYYDCCGAFLKNYSYDLKQGENKVYAETLYAAVYARLSAPAKAEVFKNCCNIIEDGAMELKEAFSSVKNVLAYTNEAHSGRYAARLYKNASAALKTVSVCKGSYDFHMYMKGDCTLRISDAASGRIILRKSFVNNSMDYSGTTLTVDAGELDIVLETSEGCYIDDLCMERIAEHPRLLFSSDELDFNRWNDEPYYSAYTSIINRNGRPNNKDIMSIILRYLKDGETEYMPSAAEMIVNELASLVSQIPAYTSERMGRRMQTYSFYYDVMTYSGFFSDYERVSARNSLIRLTNMQMSGEYGDFGNNNRNVDRYTGAACVGIVLPEYSLSDELVRHAREYAIADLCGGVVSGIDGTWPETTRYVDVVVKTMTLLSKVLYRYDGTRLSDYDGFKTMVERFTEVCTPTDKANAGGFITAPAIGDALWGEINYGTLLWVAPEYRDTEPELSRRLMYIWRQGGAVITGGNIPYGLIFGDVSLPEEEYIPESTLQRDIGYVIFRNSHMFDSQDYFIMHAPSRNFYHRHSDHGGYSIYAFGEPIMLDAGVGVYDETITGYNRTECHNAVSFIKNAELQNGPSTGAEIISFSSSKTADAVSVRIRDPLAQSYIRSAVYLKGALNSYVIYDNIESENPSISHLHMLTKDAKAAGNRICGDVRGGVKLDIDVLLPEKAEIVKQADSIYSNKDSYTNTQEYFTVSADKGGDYLMIINPHKGEGFEIVCESICQGVYKYKVSCGDLFYYVVLNKSDGEISLDSGLINAQTGRSGGSLCSGEFAVMVSEEYVRQTGGLTYTLAERESGVAVNLHNNDGKRTRGTAIAAQYEGETMLGVKIEEFDIPAGADSDISFDFGDKARGRIKVFLLNNFAGMKPLAAVGEVSHE